MPCDIVPVKAFQSTALNSKINTFTDVADRVLRSLGAPLNKIEATADMLFENISQATEMFSKYAGYTQEYLVCDTRLYEPGRGIRMDVLLTQYEERNRSAFQRDLIYTKDRYLFKKDIDKQVFLQIGVLSTIFANGIQANDVVDVDRVDSDYVSITYRGKTTPVVPLGDKSFLETICQNDPSLSDDIIQIPENEITIEGDYSGVLKGQKYKYFDYDLMNYRKCSAVTDFRATGDSLVFLSDNLNSVGALMAQPGMANSLGQFGFDLVSFHMLKSWMETREKVLQTRIQWKFDDRTQYLRLFPQPKENYIGLVECYVEKPLRDIVKEPWVQQYALALTKIQVAHVRGRYQNLSLLGGGTINYQDVMNSGVKEKETLEKQLYEGSSPGLGEAAPPRFFLR